MAYYGSSPGANGGSPADPAWYRTSVGGSPYPGQMGGYPGGYAAPYAPEYTRSSFAGPPDGKVELQTVAIGDNIKDFNNFPADSPPMQASHRSGRSSSAADNDDADSLGPPVHIAASQFHNLADQIRRLEHRYAHLLDRNALLGGRVMNLRENLKTGTQFSKADKAVKLRSWNAWVALVRDFRIENNIEKQSHALQECQEVAKELGAALAKEQQERRNVEQATAATQAEVMQVLAVCEQAQQAIEAQQLKMQKLQERLRTAEDQIWKSKQEARTVADQLETYETAKQKREADRNLRASGKSKSEKTLPTHDPVEYSTQVRQQAAGVAAEARALLPHLNQRQQQQQQQPAPAQRSPTDTSYPKVEMPRSPFEEERPPPREPVQPPRMAAPPPVQLGSSSPSRLQPPKPRPAPLDRFGVIGSEPPSPGSVSNQRPVSPMFQDGSPPMYQRPVSPMMQVRPISPMGSSAPQFMYMAPQAAARAASPMTRSPGQSPVQNVNMYTRPAPNVQFIPPQAPQVVPGYQYAAGSAPAFAFSPERYPQTGSPSIFPGGASPNSYIATAGSAGQMGPAAAVQGAPPSPLLMNRGSLGSPGVGGSPGQQAGSDGEVLEQWWCIRRPGPNGQATVTPMSQ